jgi:uncharacterized protein YbjT (DUF2867 family)
MRPVKVAIVGGTGRAGREIVDAVQRRGDDAIVVAASTGADVLTGRGLVAALRGADAVVDATNRSTTDFEEARAFFGTATRNLLAAEAETDVSHHVVLSIVGLDRINGDGYYAAKLLQEERALESRIRATIVRSTQFFDFAERVATSSLVDGVARVPPLLLQPVAVRDMAEFVSGVAAGGARNARVEVAGPETQDLVDMARRTFAARGEPIRLVPTWRGRFGLDMAGEVFLPGANAHIGATTFDDWLAERDG